MTETIDESPVEEPTAGKLESAGSVVASVLSRTAPEFIECEKCGDMWTLNSYMVNGERAKICPACRGYVPRTKENIDAVPCQHTIEYNKDIGLRVLEPGEISTNSRTCGRVDSILYVMNNLPTCPVCASILQSKRIGAFSAAKKQRIKDMLNK